MALYLAQPCQAVGEQGNFQLQKRVGSLFL
jgi:hypothetical protein